MLKNFIVDIFDSPALWKMRKEKEMLESMQASGVLQLRRSLMLIDAERGVQEGEFLSLLLASGDQLDPTTMEANADAFWAHMQTGSNGIMWCRGAAAGPLTGLHVAVTSADSADELMTTSASMFADPDIQQRLAGQNTQMVGRSMFRVIG